jgi:hypothetical protein
MESNEHPNEGQLLLGSPLDNRGTDPQDTDEYRDGRRKAYALLLCGSLILTVIISLTYHYTHLPKSPVSAGAVVHTQYDV